MKFLIVSIINGIVCSYTLFYCYYYSGCLPAGLPTSCLTMAPRFDMLKQVDLGRKPLLVLNGQFFFCLVILFYLPADALVSRKIVKFRCKLSLWIPQIQTIIQLH